MSERPGGPIASRPLHFILIVDCSGSMASDGKIQALNQAIREALPEMRRVADENPHAEILVRALAFSSGAQWHVSQPTKVADFTWTDLQADGVTDMGHALSMVAEQLDTARLGERGLPPVLVLISDGQPTDDYAAGLQNLLGQPWGRKAVRIAIAIGKDAEDEVLQKFIGHPELKPLHANRAEQLVRHIKWASTVPVKAASEPASQPEGKQPDAVNVPIPQPPPDEGPRQDDVW